MAPMPKRMKRKHQHPQTNPRSDHGQRYLARELMLNDQGDGAGNHQQECQPAKAVVAAAIMMVVAVVTVVPAVGAVFFSQGAAVIPGFIQREFVANADIDFAHLVFLIVTAICGCRKKIIIKSSNVNTRVVSQFEFSALDFRKQSKNMVLKSSKNHQLVCKNHARARRWRPMDRISARTAR